MPFRRPDTRATVGHVKRALAAALLTLMAAACSSGDDVDESAGTVGDVDEEPTTTSIYEVTPEQRFRDSIRLRLGATGDQADAALAVAEAACDMLASTSSGALEADNAAADSHETDAAASDGFSGLGLGVMFSEFDGPPEELAELLMVGAEHLCPEHHRAVIDYAAGRGIDVQALL